MTAALVLLLLACSDDAPPIPPPLPPRAPVQPTPPTPTPPDPTQNTTAPEGFPADLPFLPGGQLQPAPPGPPGLQTFTLTYPQSPTELAGSYQTALEQAGWTVEVSPPSPRGTQRMTATLGDRRVQASILPGPNGQGAGLLLMPM